MILNVFQYRNAPKYASELVNMQRRQDATGFAYHRAHHFYYFFHYTSHFPLISPNKNLGLSKDAALNEIDKNGKELLMEFEHWYRGGELARIFCFIPNTMMGQTPLQPHVRLFNGIVFTISILIFLYGLFRVRREFLGIVIAASVNLSPFFIYEIYLNKNIFGLVGSLFLLIVGLNIESIYGVSKKIKPQLLRLTFSAFILGFFTEMRNEVSILVGSLFLLIFLAKNIKLKNKLILFVLVLVSFNASKWMVRSYFKNKFKESYELVKSKEGHKYDGRLVSGHPIWHNAYLGLSDFDNKYGIKWDDRQLYNYATKFLNKNYGHNFDYKDTLSFHYNNYYDNSNKYYVYPAFVEEYSGIVMKKYMSDVLKDPIWFVKIIIKRVAKIFTVILPFHYIGWLLIPLLAFLWKRKFYSEFALLIIAMPSCLNSLLIYSDRFATYNSVFGFVILGLLAEKLYHFIKESKSQD